jgi:hypothetical protein
MTPKLDDTFLDTPRCRGLSGEARCVLEVLVQFAVRRHGDWVVEGTPAQLAGWTEPHIPQAAVVAALRELCLAGCIVRRRSGIGRETRFTIGAPIVER